MTAECRHGQTRHSERPGVIGGFAVAGWTGVAALSLGHNWYVVCAWGLVSLPVGFFIANAAAQSGRQRALR